MVDDGSTTGPQYPVHVAHHNQQYQGDQFNSSVIFSAFTIKAQAELGASVSTNAVARSKGLVLKKYKDYIPVARSKRLGKQPMLQGGLYTCREAPPQSAVIVA